ncbi:hypothetical protein BaRGS_00026658, partial [Batillaria attramentaria]
MWVVVAGGGEGMLDCMQPARVTGVVVRREDSCKGRQSRRETIRHGGQTRARNRRLQFCGWHAETPGIVTWDTAGGDACVDFIGLFTGSMSQPSCVLSKIIVVICQCLTGDVCLGGDPDVELDAMIDAEGHTELCVLWVKLGSYRVVFGSVMPRRTPTQISGAVVVKVEEETCRRP